APTQAPPQFRTLEERIVAGTIASTPHDYIAGVIQIRANCSMRCGENCYDRVQLLKVIAQAPPPAKQLAVGDEFHLFSGTSAPSALPNPGPRFLVLASHIDSEGCPDETLGASLLSVPDNDRIASLRFAFQAVTGK